MAIDMKEVIARAAIDLIVKKGKKKLTVKDIVEECNITRQAFYYHFADVPDLLEWVVHQTTTRFFAEYDFDSPEEFIKYLFLIFINGKKNINSPIEDFNYSKEFEDIIYKEMISFLTEITKDTLNEAGIDDFEANLLIKYNCLATLGLLKNWSDDDMENLDRIVHDVYLISTGQLEKL